MPPKRKDLLSKPKSKAKSKAQNPQTENDFLEAADEFEQAAGKWRAGDAAKATRFFNRAIDMYNEGLKRFPRSFDLAYNKANLEYNMCEDDRIVSQLGSKIALLEETLKSHRIATALSPDNTDVLFNTAQVLTSLAETLLEVETQHTAKIPTRKLLEEAVDLFTKCLASQQQEYEQVRAEIAKAQAEQDLQDQSTLQQDEVTRSTTQDDMETSSTASSGPGEWATVEEPLTPETILETCTAQLGALTTLLGLYDPTNLSAVEARAQLGLQTANTSIPTLINLLKDSLFQKPDDKPTGPTLSISSTGASEELATTPKDDALLAVATFQSSIAEIAYRSSRTTAAQYATEIESLFTSLIQSPQSQDKQAAYLNATSAYADALIDFAAAVADRPEYDTAAPSFSEDIEKQWAALAKAQELLTQLSTGANASLLPASRLADTFLARGDTDLFRFRIALFEVAKPAWVNSKKVLVGNAGVFYRGARTYAEKAGKVEVQQMADAKAVVAEILKGVLSSGGGVVVGKDAWKGKGEQVQKVLEQMVEEGILGRQEAEGVLKILTS